MSHRFDMPPRDEREPEWLVRLEEASYRQQLTHEDGAEMLHAIQYLRRELAATQFALDTVRDDFARIAGGEKAPEPLPDHIAEWFFAQAARVGRLFSEVFHGNAREAMAAAIELRKVDLLRLALLGPSARRSKALELQRQRAIVQIAAVDPAMVKRFLDVEPVDGEG
jgi:hypothetical protein